MANPFRFSVQSFSADSAATWRERARKTEDLGYSALLLADHFLGPGPAIETTQHPIQEFNFNNRSGVIGRDGVATSTAEATAEKIAWVREAAGPRFDSLEREIGAYFTVVTDHAEATAAGFGKALGLDASEMMRHPHALIGSVEALCDELIGRREAYGISNISVPDTALESFAPVVARLAGR